MRVQLLCFVLLAGFLGAQESDLDEVAASGFPIRLTPEEEAEQESPPQKGCCLPAPGACIQTCCKPPSVNCPPLMPRCDACDCIIDYYNPLVFNGFDLSVELLFWNVQQKSSTFALTPNAIHQPFPPTTDSDAIGRYQSAEFDWNPGVRIGLAYTFQRDAWNLLGQYTYYGTSGSNSYKNPIDQTLYLTPTNRALTATLNGMTELKSRTSFSYQVVDFLLSRRFLPACHILLNFFAGPTVALIHERWKITSINGHGLGPTTTIRNPWSFEGGGMRGGLDANWHMGAGFGLFNKFSVASLVGQYHNSRKTKIPSTLPLDPEFLTPDLRNSTEKEIWVVPATQIEFGLNWNHRFCRWSMELQGAFEINTWYDLHQVHQDAPGLTPPYIQKLDYRNTSPVSLWGFNLKMNASF